MRKSILLLAIAALFCACGPKEPPIVAVQAVSLSPSTLTLTEGDTQMLTATVSPSDATDASVNWTTSNAAVATVNAGTVTAVAPGSATITAKAGDKQASCAVTVVAKVYPVESVSLDITEKTLLEKETFTLTPTVLPENATNKSVSWSTSAAAIATVDGGKVTAVAEGTATITVTTSDGGKTATCAVTVLSTTPRQVDLGLSVKWADRNVGASRQEAVGNLYAWGETSPKQEFSWSNYRWGSEGNLSKYNAADGRTVLVEEDDAAHVFLTDKWRMPTRAEIAELETGCTWTWTEKNGAKGYEVVNKTDNSKRIFLPATSVGSGNKGSGSYWSLTRDVNPKYAWVSCFEQAVHEHWKTERFQGYPIRPVYGDYVHVTGLSVDSETAALKVGETAQLSAVVAPESAFEQAVLWSTSDAAVATVENGLVTAVSAGEARIVATSVDGNKTAVCIVTVSEVPPPSGSVYSNDFEGTDPLAGWTLIDADGDGYNWKLASSQMGTGYGHNGSSDLLFSQSYDNSAGALHPDNWAFTPAIDLGSGSYYISCWMCAQDASYPQEHYAIYVTDQAPGTDGWKEHCEKLTEGTMTASVRAGVIPRTQGAWYNKTLVIPASFQGKKVYVGFRHFNCTDFFYLNLDDIEVIEGTPTSAAAATLSVRSVVRLGHANAFRQSR